MTDEQKYDDLARELHAMRAEPRPGYARELDRRAAEWLREKPHRRLPSLRVAIPAVAAGAAAVAVVVALSVSGGDGDGGGGGRDQLEVTVIAAQAPAPAAGGGAEALDTAPQPNRPSRAVVDVFALESESVPAGQPFTVRYEVAEVTRVTVALAGREAEVEAGPGAGTLQISTDDLPPGSHRLAISTPQVPAFRGRVEIGG